MRAIHRWEWPYFIWIIAMILISVTLAVIVDPWCLLSAMPNCYFLGFMVAADE